MLSIHSGIKKYTVIIQQKSLAELMQQKHEKRRKGKHLKCGDLQRARNAAPTMAWVAEVVKTVDQALVVDERFKQFSEISQPLLYKLTVASLSATGNRAAVAAFLLKQSESIATNEAPHFPDSQELVDCHDHSVAEQLLAEIARTLIIEKASSTDEAMQVIRRELSVAASHVRESPATVPPLVPQAPELP